MSVAVYAQTITVTIGYPSASNGDLGVTAGSYWIGQFPVQITNATGTYPIEVYCLNYTGTVNEGSPYTASINPANDTAQWRAISYILSWNNPTDGTSAAIDQDAIWRVIGNYIPGEDFTLSDQIETAGANLAANAMGKDVARQGDQLKWVSPSTGNVSANADQTLTFQLQLTNSSGVPRPNVQIDFNATLQSTSGQNQTLSSEYVNSNQTFTDNNGLAQVSVTVPSYAQYGSTINLQAFTQGVWPQEYLDLTNYTSTAQDLIGCGSTLNLTVSTNICIQGFITVLPESAYGALSAIIAFSAAYLIYIKFKRPAKGQTNP